MPKLLTNRRKRKPPIMAVIQDNCTGCGGSPVCRELCPVEGCMQLIHDDQFSPFGYIWVDPLKCIGCKKCVTKGAQGTQIEGCPWDAIRMTPVAEVEAEYGELEY